MQAVTMTCDGCEKAMDPKGGRIEFKALRGGLAINVLQLPAADGKPGRELTVKHLDRTFHFCGTTCIVEFIQDATGAALAKGTEGTKPGTPATPANKDA